MSQENAYRWTRRAGERGETIIVNSTFVLMESTHGTKDILVSLMYSHAEDVGCVARIQHMPIGPLLPSEVHDISAGNLGKEEPVEQICSLLQAMSHQLSLLTNGAKTLCSFVRAKACRPIQPGEHRVVIPVFEFGANDKEVEKKLRQCVSRAFICQDGGTQLPVLPEEPFCCLPGPGIGWMAFALQNHMVHVKFDKIHRSISGTTNWRLGERAGVSFCAHSCTRPMSSA